MQTGRINPVDMSRASQPMDSPIEQQIAGFLARYDPAISALAVDARRRLRRRLPTATELVYDNYNALVFGYGASDRASDGILSIALYPRWVTLFFLHGVGLSDPSGLLQGSGTPVRGVRLSKASDLEAPAIAALITEAGGRAGTALPQEDGATVIKSVSARQRPRT